MSQLQISDALFADICANLDYTWKDESLDRKYRGYIRSGMIYINSKLGESADYESDGFPKTLLFEYVRYARDGAMDIFENNYKSMILAMQNEKAVSGYEKNAISTEQ